jgi:hypothetical protein
MNDFKKMAGMVLFALITKTFNPSNSEQMLLQRYSDNADDDDNDDDDGCTNDMIS